MLRLVAIACLLLASRSALASTGGSAEAEAPLVPSGRPAGVAGELATPRFRILYTARAEGSARALASVVEEARDQFRDVLGRDWPGVTEIRVGVGRAELEALALPDGKVPGWAVALAYPAHDLVLLEAHSLTEPDGPATLRHELSHVALGQLGGTWPRWFQEGLAVTLAGERRYSLGHYATLFRAVQQDRVVHFEDLSDRWPDHPSDVDVAYAQSAAFVAYLVERHGPAQMGTLLDGVRAGESFETSFAKAFHTSLLLDERDWRAELPRRYTWIPVVTGGSTLWAIAAGITFVGYLRRRRANARKRAGQEAEELAEAAARALAEGPSAEPAHPSPVEVDDNPSGPGPEDDRAESGKPTLH